jgi:NAD(P)H dehydrogenase (quinone)
MKILVTGATGKLGSKVVEALLKNVPAELAVSVRNPEKAENLKAQGVEVRYGDLINRKVWIPLLRGLTGC